MYIGEQVGTQANNLAIDAASTQLVDGVAQQVAVPVSDLATLIRADITANITDKLSALDDRNPVLPVGPVTEFLKGQIRDAVQAQIQSRVSELQAAIRSKVQARVTQIKIGLENQISSFLTSQLNRSASFYDNALDPLIGMRGRLNLTKAFYLTAETDVSRFPNRIRHCSAGLCHVRMPNHS